jgi:hypothetical protein
MLAGRIRKIKCDESKPYCQKCVSTGRACDGYEEPFRFFMGCQPISNTPTASQDVELLNRCFSTKTIFEGVNLGLDEEAKQILQASLTELPIRHAVSSLRALRENFDAFGLQQTLKSGYALQKYGMALGGLASNLSSPGSGVKSTLLCCQVLVSIEQTRGDYVAMAQHISQGLSIMRQHQEKPYFAVFVIKMFAAPCKFAERPTTLDETAASCPLRRIAPDRRTELRGIALSALEFLDKASRAESAGEAPRQLLSEKASLLGSLDSWLTDLDLAHAKTTQYPAPEPLSASFMHLFHQTLRIILLGVLDSSPKLHAQLRVENDRLQGIATTVGEGVRSYYRTCGGSGSGPRRAA